METAIFIVASFIAAFAGLGYGLIAGDEVGEAGNKELIRALALLVLALALAFIAGRFTA